MKKSKEKSDERIGFPDISDVKPSFFGGFNVSSLIVKENPYVELVNHFTSIRPKPCNHMV